MAYGSEKGFRDWLAQNGYVLCGEDAGVPALLSRATGYIDSTFGARFSGVATALDQPNQWPRSGVVIGGRALPEDFVPPAIVEATYRAARAEGQGYSLSRVYDPAAAQVKREKVDVIETEYFEPINAGSGLPIIPGVESLLTPFLVGSNATRSVFFGRV